MNSNDISAKRVKLIFGLQLVFAVLAIIIGVITTFTIVPLIKEKNQLEEDVTILNQEIDELTTDKNKLTTEKENLEDKIDSLDKEVADLEDQKELLQKDISISIDFYEKLKKDRINYLNYLKEEIATVRNVLKNSNYKETAIQELSKIESTINKNVENIPKEFNVQKELDTIKSKISSNPNQGTFYIDRSNLLNILRKYTEAKKDIEKAIILDPNYHLSYNKLSRVNAILGDYDEAILNANKAIKLADDDQAKASAYNRRGLTYYLKGKMENAIQDLLQASTLVPNKKTSGFYLENLGFIYLNQRDWQKTIENSMLVENNNSDTAGNYLIRAIAYHNMRNIEEAKTAFDLWVEKRDEDSIEQLEVYLPFEYRYYASSEELPPHLVPANYFDSTIILDSKYATDQNFFQTKFYTRNVLFVQYEVAEQLRNAQKYLKTKKMGLKIWDAYRPASVQKSMWEILPDSNYVAIPGKGSNHNKGCAVDVTLVDLDGKELQMPTVFDDFSEKAHIEYHNLNPTILENRKVLIEAMEQAGFNTYKFEWWHFSSNLCEKYSYYSINPYIESNLVHM